MARMPGAEWLGEHAPRQSNGLRLTMQRYDIVCIHTIVGRAPAHAAHLSVRGNGKILQSRDTRYRSAANVEGNHRVIAIENEDMGPEFGEWPSEVNAPPLTDEQVQSNAEIVAWVHETHGTPLQLCPNSRPTSQGLAYHRQGIDGNFGPFRYPGRVSGGETWTEHFGKVCPTDNRIAQRPLILSIAKQIITGETQEEEDEVDFTEKVQLSPGAAKILGLEKMSFGGLLGYAATGLPIGLQNAAAIAEMHKLLLEEHRYSSAQGRILIDLANGVDVSPESVAEIVAASKAVAAGITAVEVAEQLDIVADQAADGNVEEGDQ